MLRFVTLKFLRTYLFLWGHELANSLRLFKLHRSFFCTDDNKLFAVKT